MKKGSDIIKHIYFVSVFVFLSYALSGCTTTSWETSDKSDFNQAYDSAMMRERLLHGYRY
jgi:hypothetical protein